MGTDRLRLAQGGEDDHGSESSSASAGQSDAGSLTDAEWEAAWLEYLKWHSMQSVCLGDEMLIEVGDRNGIDRD
jgi:hypothetical protein